MDTFNLHVENYLFAKFRNIWPKAIFQGFRGVLYHHDIAHETHVISIVANDFNPSLLKRGVPPLTKFPLMYSDMKTRDIENI